MSWWHKIATIRHFVVLEIDPNQPNEASYLEVKFVKSDLTILEMKQQDLSELDVSLPIVLVISGKRVVFKEKQNEGDKLTEVFPNLKGEDLHVVHHEKYISVVRKSILDPFLDRGWNVVDVLHGLPLLTQLTALSENEISGEVEGKHWTIKTDTVQISESFEFSDLKVDDQIVPVEYWLGLGGAIAYFSDLPHDTIEVLSQNKEEVSHQLIFKKAGVMVLIFFLFTLLINFFAFNQLNQNATGLTQGLAQNHSILNQLQLLELQLSEKKEFLKNESWMRSSNYSMKADDLGRIMPDKIKLTKLELSTIKKHPTDPSLMVFDGNEILIEGRCNQSSKLNQWKKRIKGLEWVKEVKIEKYSRTDKGAVFLLKIAC